MFSFRKQRNYSKH